MALGEFLNFRVPTGVKHDLAELREDPEQRTRIVAVFPGPKRAVHGNIRFQNAAAQRGTGEVYEGAGAAKNAIPWGDQRGGETARSMGLDRILIGGEQRGSTKLRADAPTIGESRGR